MELNMDLTVYNDKLDFVAEKLLSDSSSCVYTDEGTAIGRSVKRLVKKFVDQVGHVDSRFKVSELLAVGGFYEGTKVGKADEFDYIVIIEELSTPGALKAHTDGPMKATFTFVDPDLQTRWADFVEDETLRNFSCNYRTNSEGHTFGGIMVNTIKQLLPTEKTELYDGSNIIIGHDDVDAVIDFVDDEDLSLVSISVRIPNIIINMEWRGMSLSADISPAFRYHDVDDLLTKDQFLHPAICDKIRNKESLLLVTTASDDHAHFKITFTEIEFAMVKELSPIHVKVYRLVKYIHYVCKKKISYIEYRSKLTSYVYKTACICMHLFRGNDVTAVITYIFDVFNHIYLCLDRRHIPPLFSKQQNLFRFQPFEGTVELVMTSKQELVLIAQVLQYLLTTHDDLSTLNEKMMVKLVASFWKKGVCKGYQKHFISVHIKRFLLNMETNKYGIRNRYRQKKLFGKRSYNAKRQLIRILQRGIMYLNATTVTDSDTFGEMILQGKIIKHLDRRSLSKFLDITKKFEFKLYKADSMFDEFDLSPGGILQVCCLTI